MEYDDICDVHCNFYRWHLMYFQLHSKSHSSVLFGREWWPFSELCKSVENSVKMSSLLFKLWTKIRVWQGIVISNIFYWKGGLRLWFLIKNLFALTHLVLKLSPLGVCFTSLETPCIISKEWAKSKIYHNGNIYL